MISDFHFDNHCSTNHLQANIQPLIDKTSNTVQWLKEINSNSSNDKSSDLSPKWPQITNIRPTTYVTWVDLKIQRVMSLLKVFYWKENRSVLEYNK